MNVSTRTRTLAKLVALIMVILCVFQLSAVAEEVQNIVFYDMQWGTADYPVVAQELVDRFNAENPTIHVEYQSIPWANAYTTFVTTLSSNAGLDVSTGSGVQQAYFAAEGAILELDDLVAEMKAEGIFDFKEESANQFMYDGHYVGIPWNYDAKVIYYRADVFAELGIKVPTTRQEFEDALYMLKANGKPGFALNLGENGGGLCYLGFAMNAGTGLWDEDRNPIFNSPENVEVLTWFRKLYNDGLILPGSVGYLGSDVNTALIQGDCMMAYGNITNDVLNAFGSDIQILPILSDVNSYPIQVVNHAMMVYNRTKYPEACFTFIKWWSQNNLELWTRGGSGNFPARLSFLNNEYFKTIEQKKFIIEELISHGVARFLPCPIIPPEAQSMLAEYPVSKAMVEAFITDEDIASILDRWNDEIASYNVWD